VTTQVGATWTTDAPFRETGAAIATAEQAGILAVEMEAAALYAFAAAWKKPLLWLAHVTNQIGRIEGDFEKGAADGAQESLKVISQVARRWRDQARPRNLRTATDRKR
jgi:purine-nucleoside phosphorylase